MILVIVGALNWLLIGMFGFNLVATIFGSVGWLERFVYILVGLSGVWLLFTLLPAVISAPSYKTEPARAM
jgi:uncharacterized membrane protein YuzA (DUF378 family)